jgi:hypothetical protein
MTGTIKAGDVGRGHRKTKDLILLRKIPFSNGTGSSNEKIAGLTAKQWNPIGREIIERSSLNRQRGHDVPGREIPQDSPEATLAASASDQIQRLIITKKLGDAVHPALPIQRFAKRSRTERSTQPGEQESQSRWIKELKGQLHTLQGSSLQQPTTLQIGSAFKGTKFPLCIESGDQTGGTGILKDFQLITSLIGEVTQREIPGKQDLTNPQTATLQTPMK